MEYTIKKNDGSDLITVDIDCAEDASCDIKLGKAVLAAVRLGINLRGANLYGVDLYGADLSEANLYGVDLRKANLYEANLSRADLSRADLRKAVLRWVDLYGANLYGANLYGVNLYGANMRKANLSEANLRGAVLYEVKGVYSFGPIGREGRIGYAVKHESYTMIKLGCFWGTEKEAIAAIKDKYGPRSTYASQVRLAAEILKEQK